MAKTNPNIKDVSYAYSPRHRALVEAHIEKYFGAISFILSQVTYQDIKLDIAVIEPDSRRNFYLLITMGLGAYQMNAQGSQSNKLDRCEMMIMLDPEWKIPSSDENYYWPVRLLKDIAHQTINENHFLDWGYCFSKGKPFAPDTELSYAMLCGLNKFFPAKAQALRYEFNDINEPDFELAFYLVVPMYEGEYRMILDLIGQKELTPLPLIVEEEKLNNFIAQMRHISPFVQNKRGSGTETHTEYSNMIFEDMRWHASTIENKHLPVEELAALNHLAILLRYMIENDMISPFLHKLNPQVLEYVRNPKQAPKDFDFRQFILEELAGVLDRRLFNQRGLLFLNYYFNDQDSSPKFSADIDSYALRYFGIEEYYSKKFDTEGYLFVPYSEKYYQDMKSVIDKRRESFEEQEYLPVDNFEELKILFARYLDCPVYYFPSLKNDSPIQSRMAYDYRTGVVNGYIPVAIELNTYLLEEANDYIEELIHNELKYSYNAYKEKQSHKVDHAYATRFGLNDATWQFDPDKLSLVRKYFMRQPLHGDKGFAVFAEDLEYIIEQELADERFYKLYANIQMIMYEEFERDAIELEQLEQHILELNKQYLKEQKTPRHQWPGKRDAFWKSIGLLPNKDAYRMASLALGSGATNEVENLHLSSYWDEEFKRTKPLLVARIPVNNPTKILPYLACLYPFSHRALPLELCHYVKHLFKVYHAVPAVITCDGIEFVTLKPLNASKALALANEILSVGDYVDEAKFTPANYTILLRFLTTILSNNKNGEPVSFFLPLTTSEPYEDEDDDWEDDE